MTIKEKVAKNYENRPLNERNETIELEIGSKDYIKIAKYAKTNGINTKELIFMMIVDKIDKDEPFLDD